MVPTKQGHQALLSNLCRSLWQSNISLIYLDTPYKMLQRKCHLDSPYENYDLLHLFLHWWRKAIQFGCCKPLKKIPKEEEAALTHQRGGFSAYSTELGWMWSSWSSRIVLENKTLFQTVPLLLLNIWFLSAPVWMFNNSRNERAGVNEQYLHLMNRWNQA